MSLAPLWAMALLLTKHFVVDFLLQPPWMWRNKGTWGHPGGIAHAGLHGLVTVTMLMPFMFSPRAALWLGFVDGGTHYLVDYAKMQITGRWGLRADNSPVFWWLLGLDQWLHHATYIVLVAIIFWR